MKVKEVIIRTQQGGEVIDIKLSGTDDEILEKQAILENAGVEILEGFLKPPT